MDNPNFMANVAYTFETEHRRNDSRSGSVGGGSVYANPPDWAGFSLRKLWSKFSAHGKTALAASNKDEKIEDSLLQA